MNMAAKGKDWKEIREFFKRMKLDFQELGAKEVIKIMIIDFIKITVYSMLPSVLCTVNMLCGFNTMSLMWIMTVSTAYIGHRNDKKKNQNLGLKPIRSWIQFGTLLLIILGGFFGDYPSIDMISMPTEWSQDSLFEIAANFLKILPCFQLKTCQQVAMYRLYMSLFGAASSLTRDTKNRKKKLQKQTEQNEPMEIKEDFTGSDSEELKLESGDGKTILPRHAESEISSSIVANQNGIASATNKIVEESQPNEMNFSGAIISLTDDNTKVQESNVEVELPKKVLNESM